MHDTIPVMGHLIAKLQKTCTSPTAHASAAQSSVSTWCLVMFGLLGVYMAWHWRGVYEDGFIFLRLIDNLASGRGLVFNPGLVEGAETNTDFLWPLLGAVGIILGLEPLNSMVILSMVFCAASFILLARLARLLYPKTPLAPHVAVALLAVNFTYSAFAANGFGTMLLATTVLLALLALYHFAKKPTSMRRGGGVGISLAAVLLCRLDAALFLIPLAVGVTIVTMKSYRKNNSKSTIASYLIAGVIPTATLTALLLWKLWYYGDVLPATYYAKASADAAGTGKFGGYLVDGGVYLFRYWVAYGLFLLTVLSFIGWSKVHDRGRGWRRRKVVFSVAMVAVIMYQGYMLRTGGDYYAFRILAPQTPLLMLLLAPGIAKLRLPLVGVTLAIAAGSSLWHAHGNRLAHPMTHVLAQDAELSEPSRAHLGRSSRLAMHNLIPTGVALNDLFGHLGDFPRDVRMASIALGAHGYYSRLEFIEMHGINDRRIVDANPELVYHYPSEPIGHRLIAKPELLASLDVNIIVHDVIFPQQQLDFSETPFSMAHVDYAHERWARLVAQHRIASPLELPPGSRLISMPLNGNWSVPLLYIKPSATIDEVIEKHGLHSVPVRN